MAMSQIKDTPESSCFYDICGFSIMNSMCRTRYIHTAHMLSYIAVHSMVRIIESINAYEISMEFSDADITSYVEDSMQ